MSRIKFNNKEIEREIASHNNDHDYENCMEKEKLLHLPIEIILEIISHLDDINDFKSCTLLCKQIRVLMHKTPKIMRKYEVTIFLDDHNDFLEYPIVKKRGKFIRNMKLKFYNLSKLPLILSKVPNLEVLTYEYKNENNSESVEIPKLKHLKYIISDDSIHKVFLLETAKITTLKALKVSLQNLEDAEILTNFLSRQSDLKELIVIDDLFLAKIFITRDISNDIKFNLTKFEYNLNDYGENFLKFLKTQAGSLKKLNLRFNPTYKVFNTIFANCKKLEIFKITRDCHLTYEDTYYWELPSLKHFSAQSTLNFTIINKLFPNLVSLECFNLAPYEGTISKLETLIVTNFFDCRIFSKLKLPNLKNLSARAVEGEIWKQFKRNVPKLENLEFTGVPVDVFIILKSLDYFKELKIFKQFADCCERLENVGIFIDITKKIVKYDKCRFEYKIVTYLNEKYVEFKIKNICTENLD